MKYKLMALLLALPLAVVSQQLSARQVNDADWEFLGDGASIVDYMGRRSLRLNGGMAVLKDQQFKDGTISFDVALSDARGFAGVYFRWNDNTAEHFYLRPHNSGKPDSTQYSPRFNGLSAWQMLFGKRYSTPTAYRFDTWFPVKLVIKDNKMDVFVDTDSDIPSLHVDNLMAPDISGGIRFSGAGQNFHISNVKVVDNSYVKIVGVAPEKVAFPENLITRFTVGTKAVAGAAVEAKTTLDRNLLNDQMWETLEVDETGSANLARISGRSRDVNTLFVKFKMNAQRPISVPFQYGFSDRVTVFLNGRAIAYGDDTYQTRDYRHLGTVGLYDTVFLPLEAGENELIFAVTEAFGGWGIKAAMAPVSGVTVD